MAEETPTAYPCPICESEMSVKAFQRGIGFKYQCLGSPETPHTVQLYIKTGFPSASGVFVRQPERPDSSFTAKVGERTESLLERVKRLSGKGE